MTKTSILMISGLRQSNYSLFLSIFPIANLLYHYFNIPTYYLIVRKEIKDIKKQEVFKNG